MKRCWIGIRAGLLFFLITISVSNIAYAEKSQTAMPSSQKALKSYPRLKSLFTFGVWGIPSMRFQDYYSPVTVRFGDYGDVQPLRNLRKNYCNAVLNPGAGPVYLENDKKSWVLLGEEDKKYSYADYLARLVKYTEKYDIYFAPLTAGVIPEEKSLIERFRESQRLLGWYLRDEPPVSWLNDFIKAKKFIESYDKLHPAFVLCCSDEQVKSYAPYCSLVVTDNYTLFNPIFRKGKYLKRDPWEVTDWCKLVEANSADKPHYLTLSCHSFWSNAYPTVAEVRLQTYLGLAHGADGIYYFVYSYGPQWLYKYIEKTLFDPYGNPSDLWREIGKIGKKLLPIGDTIMMSKEDSGALLEISNTRSINTVRGSMKCVQGIVRVNPKGIRLVYLWNNDLQYSQMADFCLKVNNNGGEFLYDLMTWEKLGAANRKHSIHLSAGDGRILAICNQKTFEHIRRSALRKEIENELIRLQIDLEVATLNRIECSQVEKDYKLITSSLSANELEIKTIPKLKACLADIISLQEQLTQIIASDTQYSKSLEQMIRARRALGRMHVILSDKLEAPRVVIALGRPRPFAVTKLPGRAYAQQALLLSLAFKELSKRQSQGKTRDLEVLARFVADETEKFADKCENEFSKHNPAIPKIKSNISKKLVGIVGKKNWEYKKLWLERDNGVNQAFNKRKTEAAK